MVRAGSPPALETLDSAITEAQTLADTVRSLMTREMPPAPASRCLQADLSAGREQLFQAINAVLDTRNAIAGVELDPARARGHITSAQADARQAVAHLTAITEEVGVHVMTFRRLLDDETAAEA